MLLGQHQHSEKGLSRDSFRVGLGHVISRGFVGVRPVGIVVELFRTAERARGSAAGSARDFRHAVVLDEAAQSLTLPCLRPAHHIPGGRAAATETDPRMAFVPLAVPPADAECGRSALSWAGRANSGDIREKIAFPAAFLPLISTRSTHIVHRSWRMRSER